jgi:hypothetical protein
LKVTGKYDEFLLFVDRDLQKVFGNETLKGEDIQFSLQTDRFESSTTFSACHCKTMKSIKGNTQFLKNPKVSSTVLDFVISGFVVLLILFIVGAGIFCVPRLRRGNFLKFIMDDQNVMPYRKARYDDRFKHHNISFSHNPGYDAWQLKPGCLVILDDEQLGSGAFAVVFRGILQGRPPAAAIHNRLSIKLGLAGAVNMSVAVKRLTPHATDMDR